MKTIECVLDDSGRDLLKEIFSDNIGIICPDSRLSEVNFFIQHVCKIAPISAFGGGLSIIAENFERLPIAGHIIDQVGIATDLAPHKKKIYAIIHDECRLPEIRNIGINILNKINCAKVSMNNLGNILSNESVRGRINEIIFVNFNFEQIGIGISRVIPEIVATKDI